MAAWRIALHLVAMPSHIRTLAQDTVFVLVVLSVCLLTARLAVRWLEARTPRMLGGIRSVSILTIIARSLVFLVGGLVVLNQLGVSIAPLITALGIGGLAVALALQDTLTNLFAGLQLLASEQLNVGDFVKLEQGEEGYVMDITWRNTIIQALSNQLVVVPNAKLASSIIMNRQLPDPAVSVLVDLSVAYGSDLEEVERETIGVARRVMRRLQPELTDFDPFIRYNTFGESGIGFSVILRVREFTERYLLIHAFIKALHRRYREAGIVIPYPMRTLQIEIPEQVGHG